MKIHGTAKGGAIGKKDFGVAFSATAPLVETCQGTGYSGDYTGLGHTAFNGEDEVQVGFTPETGNTLLDTPANNFSLKMRLNGSPSDPVVGARIYDDSAVLQQTSTNTIDDLDGTFTFRIFNFASNFTVTRNYRYVIYLVSGDVDDSNRVDINMNGVPIDNNITPYQTTPSESWFSYNLGCTICFNKT